jgi:DNA mismatch repair ATPase MutL
LNKKSEFSLVDVPNELLDAFNLQACKGAIKFGDDLDNKTCESMISCLSSKTYPFYCAHGRPRYFEKKKILYN